MFARTILLLVAMTASAHAGSKRALALSDAIAADDAAAVSELLNRKDDRTELLLQAAERGAVAVMAMLIDGGAPAQSAVIEAVRAGRSEAVALLVDCGVTLMPPAVHLAAQAGDVAMVRQLASHGADLSAVDDEGRTPARTLSACGEHRAVYEVLYAAGAAAMPAPLCEGSTERDWLRLTELADIATRAAAPGGPMLPSGDGWRAYAARGLRSVDTELDLETVLGAAFREELQPVCGGGRWCRATLASDNGLLCEATGVVLVAVEAAKLAQAPGVESSSPRVRLDCDGGWMDLQVRYPGRGEVMAELEHHVGEDRVWVQALGFPVDGWSPEP